jgi:hypothetical protein
MTPGIHWDNQQTALARLALVQLAYTTDTGAERALIATMLTDLETAHATFRCEAVIHTGPGHQSKHRCTRTDPHPIDGDHYVTQTVHEWTGPQAYAEYRELRYNP